MYSSYDNIAIDNNVGYETVVSLPTMEIAMTPKEKNSSLTAEWLRENMNYDPANGMFSWSKPGFGRTVGKLIGLSRKKGRDDYMTIKVNNVVYYAHRLAWLHHYGQWPTGTIDHIDGNRQNNAISNLRVATSAQNAARRNTTRFIGPSRGVFPHGAGFVARIHHGGVRHYLGYFSNAEDAREAYEAKAREIHGEFAHEETEKVRRVKFGKSDCCNICDGTNNLRRDRTNLGAERGTLCVDCWAICSTALTSENFLKLVPRLVAYLRHYETEGPQQLIAEPVQ